jgi:hypothetical protein
VLIDVDESFFSDDTRFSVSSVREEGVSAGLTLAGGCRLRAPSAISSRMLRRGDGR